MSKVTIRDMQRAGRKISKAANRIKTIKFIIAIVLTVIMIIGLVWAIQNGLAGAIKGVLS